MTHSQAHPDDADFLKAYDPGQFQRPSVAVDVALVSVHEGELRVLLIRRDEQPQRGSWSLPGGFVRMDEDLEQAARRVLVEKAGLEGLFLEQLYTFGAPERDPRMRVISVAYYALVDHARFQAPSKSPSCASPGRTTAVARSASTTQTARGCP